MAKDEQGSHIPTLQKFPSTVWGSSFATSFDSNALAQEYESLTKEVETFKEKVKEMFLIIQSTKDHLIDNIELIDLLCRLGVSYHFEMEIDEKLESIFTLFPSLVQQNDYDLYATALVFRILRQHGFKMSSDVFEKFKNSQGEFKESQTNDVKGMLSLYEASFLAVRGEDILDEALSFTKKHLEMISKDHSDSISNLQKKHIKNALFFSFHKNMNRVAVLWYIPLYEEDESQNKTLLKFAKFDFNRLQSLYKQELGLLSRWWKDMNLIENLSYVRDRIVESYLWSLGSQFQPQFTLARIMMAKYTAMATVIDDTYDSFAELHDLHPFTAAIHRGAIDPTDQLPEYMKAILEAFFDFQNETEIGGRNAFVKEACKKLASYYLDEKKWFVEGYNPPLNEYLDKGSITISTLIYPAASFIGLEDMVGMEEFKWLQNNSKIEGIVNLYCRLIDDIEDDKYNEISCITCYMKENGVSREKAMEEIEKMKDNVWKDINEEYMRMKSTRSASKILLDLYLNESRTVTFIFTIGDAFTQPLCVKDYITSLFLQKLP